MIRLAGISIAFAFITLVVTHPVVTHFNSHIPQGTEPAGTVPLFNAWTLWWNLDRAESGLEDYWNAPIFHPTEGTFAYSEPQPVLMYLVPLEPVFTLAGLYNIYLLLSLWLNGLLGYALFRGLNFSRSVAFCGGVLIETLPFTHWQLGVLQLVPLWGALWVILSLVKLNGSPSFWWSASLGTALAMTYWCCNYYGVFLVMLLAPAGLILVRDRLREGRFWKQVALAAVWFALLAGPLIWGQLKYINDSGFERNAARVAELSAVPEDYVLFPFESRLNPIHLQQTDEPQRWALSAGLFSYLLSLAGFIFYVCTDRYRAWALFSLVFCVVSYLLSLGPALDELGVPLYRLLTTVIPGYSKIRSLYRFAVFFQLGCAFLGVLFLQLAVETIPNRRSRRLQITLLVAVALLFGVTLAERWPAPSHLTPVPWIPSEPEWCRFLREQTPPDAALACFPFPADKQASDYEQQTHWMLSIPWHHRPLVNGYSGFLPESFFQIRSATQDGLDSDCLELLRETGVQYCVVKQSWIEKSPLPLEDFADNPGLQRVFADPDEGIGVYEIISEKVEH
jgi:hypothetical protein